MPGGGGLEVNIYIGYRVSEHEAGVLAIQLHFPRPQRQVSGRCLGGSGAATCPGWAKLSPTVRWTCGPCPWWLDLGGLFDGEHRFGSEGSNPALSAHIDRALDRFRPRISPNTHENGAGA